MKLKLLFLLLMICGLAQAETPVVKWARSFGGPDSDYTQAQAVDNNGNVIVAGYFVGNSIAIGSIELHNSIYGKRHVFLAKYDSTGNVLWAKSTEDFESGCSLSVSVTSNDEIVMCGYFNTATITFGTYTLRNDYVGGLNAKLFYVKYDSSGNVIWAKTSSNSSRVNSMNSICTDKSGNIYATGYFQGDLISFDDLTLKNTYFVYDEIFLVKFDKFGNVVWGKSIGKTSSDIGKSITTDDEGNVILVGEFSEKEISFGSYTLTNNLIGVHNIFIAKYNADGEFQWAKSAGGMGNSLVTTVTVDSSGSSYIGGSFGNNSTSASINFGEITLKKDLYGNLFIAKYDNTGNFKWAKSTTNNLEPIDIIQSVYADKNNNVYSTGHYHNKMITFDTITLHNSAYPAKDVFLTKFNSDGKVLWAKSYGGFGMNEPTSINIDRWDNIYLAGNFLNSTMPFDSINILNYNQSGWDSFIAKIKLDSTFDPVEVNYCAADSSIILDAPKGYKLYNWTYSNGNTAGLNQIIQIINPSDSLKLLCKMTSLAGVENTKLFTIHRYELIADFSSFLSDCKTNTVQFTNHSTTNQGSLNYVWDFGDGTTSTESNPLHKYATARTYQVTLTARSSDINCTNSTSKSITYYPGNDLIVEGNLTFCKGDSTTLTASGAKYYSWNTGETTEKITVDKPGIYTITGRNETYCANTLSVNVQENPLPLVDFSLSDYIIDSRNNSVTVTAKGDSDVSYFWDMGDGTTETGHTIKHYYNINNSQNEYSITLTGINPQGCSNTKTIKLNVEIFIPNIFSPNRDGINDIFMPGVNLEVFNRNGMTLYKGLSGWDGNYNGKEMPDDTYYYVVSYKDNKGQVQIKKGYIILKR